MSGYDSDDSLSTASVDSVDSGHGDFGPGPLALVLPAAPIITIPSIALPAFPAFTVQPLNLNSLLSVGLEILNTGARLQQLANSFAFRSEMESFASRMDSSLFPNHAFIFKPGFNQSYWSPRGARAEQKDDPNYYKQLAVIPNTCKDIVPYTGPQF